MTAASSQSGASAAWRHSAGAGAAMIAALLLALLAVAATAAAIGAAGSPLRRLPTALGLSAYDADPAVLARDQLVLWTVRLPRIAMAAMVGALLAGGGAIMQGLFRNPLADPALVGVSTGGALAAVAAIVAGDRLLAGLQVALPFQVLPLASFGGALLATLVLYRISTHENRTSIAIFLLGGLAVAALASAGTGLLVFAADDRQLRDITFWLLGSLGGATWAKVAAVLPFTLALLLAAPFIAHGLDLLALGEAEAFHMGVSVERLKRVSIVMISASIGAAVAFTGVIGFVGIVVPHLIRLVIGPSHRRLLPATLIFGAILLLAADTCARTIAAPAEIPIGILTALIGAPFFLTVLLRQRALVGS